MHSAGGRSVRPRRAATDRRQEEQCARQGPAVTDPVSRLGTLLWALPSRTLRHRRRIGGRRGALCVRPVGRRGYRGALASQVRTTRETRPGKTRGRVPLCSCVASFCLGDRQTHRGLGTAFAAVAATCASSFRIVWMKVLDSGELSVGTLPLDTS